MRMAMRPRSSSSEFSHNRPPHVGAVLILLYPRDNQLFLPLTRRSERVASHKGQISLPGGAQERGDSSLWDTALREAFEEVAVDPHQVQYIGTLSHLYISVSNFNVAPFVGYVPFRPNFVPDTDEVAELIEMPLQTILDSGSKREESWLWRGRKIRPPFYLYQEHVIWGATAVVLSELEVMLVAELQGR